MKAVSAVNRQTNADEFSYARKAMSLIVMDLNLNDQWEECQLLTKPQRTIETHRHYSDGTPGESD